MGDPVYGAALSGFERKKKFLQQSLNSEWGKPMVERLECLSDGLSPPSSWVNPISGRIDRGLNVIVKMSAQAYMGDLNKNGKCNT